MECLSDLSWAVDKIKFAALLRDHTKYTVADNMNYPADSIEYANDLTLMSERVASSMEKIRFMAPGRMAYDVALLCKYLIDRTAPVTVYGRIAFFWGSSPMACVIVNGEFQFSISIDMESFLKVLKKNRESTNKDSQRTIFKAVENGFLGNPPLGCHVDLREQRAWSIVVVLAFVLFLIIVAPWSK